MEQSMILEEKRQEIMDKLASNLIHFKPVLDGSGEIFKRKTKSDIH
jgi:hypothetical protein